MRGLRVCFLLVPILAMSIADLYLTLTYLRGPGMGEGNPIARWVMSANCVWALGAFKMGLVTLSCALLFKARHRLSGELASWLCCAVMVWLTLQWREYSEQMSALTPIIHHLATAPSGDWVRFTDD